MENIQLNNEKGLLHRIAAGDEKAFRIFFDLYKERFYAVVLKMAGSDAVAQEMVQDIFLKIWQNRASLSEINNPEAYFFTSLYRQVYRHFKKLALDKKLVSILSQSPGFNNITDETLLARESERVLNEAVAKLPPQQQTVFRLSRQQGLSREQIATELNLSPNTVRNHLAEAIKFIKAHLNKSALVYLLLHSFCGK